MRSMQVLRAAAIGAPVAAMVAVCLVAVFVSATLAVIVLAIVLGCAALLRALSSGPLVPSARSRAFDVSFLLALAVALAYLSAWADATAAGG